MNIQAQIKQLSRTSKSKLKKDVCRIILNHLDGYDNPLNFFLDLERNGCQSGIIGELSYYANTHKFFLKHCEEIMELLNELKYQTGEEIKINGEDRMNFYAWLAFEETAKKIIENDLMME
jgi:hypothetical protein